LRRVCVPQVGNAVTVHVGKLFAAREWYHGPVHPEAHLLHRLREITTRLFTA
jgi:hypothetical protein